ncbi:MAG TPA: enoyl-CoA hydratase [Acidimicrobiales bacterium]|nr:enoyl-CoA hydratase [Acidimicrobiales bacterium]
MTVVYDTPADGVARLTLDRPEVRNAQNVQLLYDLNAAFDRAAADDDVRVVILAANGPHFSAGHDLYEDPVAVIGEHRTVGTWCGFGCAGAEGRMGIEKEIYLGFSERWRNLPKPTIAQVHGKVIAGGLMLVWPCDLVVASDDATFADNTVAMGVAGAEFFHHPWEVGARKAKEMLFTSDELTAADALRVGMVNHVVPRQELPAFTLALASRIAAKPLFALKTAKEAVNAAQDAQGRPSAMQTAFALHQLCHTHNLVVHGQLIDPGYLAPRKADA